MEIVVLRKKGDKKTETKRTARVLIEKRIVVDFEIYHKSGGVLMHLYLEEEWNVTTISRTGKITAHLETFRRPYDLAGMRFDQSPIMYEQALEYAVASALAMGHCVGDSACRLARALVTRHVYNNDIMCAELHNFLGGHPFLK